MLIFPKFPQFLMETPEAPAGAGEPPAVTPEPVAPAPVPTPAAGDAPWSADLAALGLDDTGRSAVDQYLRTSVQPRVTQLEQEVATSKVARELFTDLQEAPLETFLAVGEQLFEGADPNALRAALGLPPEDAPPAVAPAAPELDPRVAKLIADDEAREAQRHWDTSMAPIKAADATITDAIFSPFVVAAGGDFDQAKALYDQQVAALRTAHGLAPEVVVPAEAVPAPDVIGTGTGGGTVPPPTETQYGSLSDAFDATLAEVRAAREAPSVV